MRTSKTEKVYKRLGGFANIHVAPKTGAITYGTPTGIPGAKNLSAELAFNKTTFYADNKIDEVIYTFEGGEGTLTITGLTAEEYALLFGSVIIKGGVMVSSSDVAPELALLFDKLILGTRHKRLFELFNVKFAPASITAQTQEGSTEEEPIELTFSIAELNEGQIYYFVDTNATGADQELITNFYTTVTVPVETPVLDI